MEHIARQAAKNTTPPGGALFYRNSGVFDPGGNLVASGLIDSTSVKQLQSNLQEEGMLIVVDLVDTWIHPFFNERQWSELMGKVVLRAPFLITKGSIFLVAKLGPFIKPRYTMDGIEITVLDPQSAKTRILASNSSLAYS